MQLWARRQALETESVIRLTDFSRVTAKSSAGGGPQYWIVEREDGLTYTYGDSADSRVLATGTSTVHQWMIREIKDRNNNRIVFTWKSADSTTTGTTHPVKIEWTPTYHNSGSYVYSMEFSYDAGTNSATSMRAGYVYAKEVKDSDLLNSITIKTSGSVVRKYALTYEGSTSTGAKRLTEVKECSDSSLTDCLLPTTIAYQNGSAGVNTSDQALYVSGSITDADGSYDFNGDGIKDIAYQLSGTWYVRIASAGGYGSAVPTGLPTLRAGKIRGTAADQLVGVSGGYWYVYSWNGSSFSDAGCARP